MVGIKIFKTKTILPEFYGQVIFDGQKLNCKGLTCVFQKYLERGFVDENRKKITPKDGLTYLDSLRFYLREQGLKVSDFSTKI